MKTMLFYLVLLYVCSSCNKSNIIEGQITPDKTNLNSFKEYIIKKGNHYSDQNSLQILNSSSIIARVIFDSSAIYTTLDQSNQGDINKLIGFSDCGTAHHENSARLGWSWNGREVVIYAYAYVNTERISKALGPVELNRPFDCSVKADSNYYYFQAEKYIDSIPRYCNRYNGSRYKLFPYFGGDETASHDIRIAISESKN